MYLIIDGNAVGNSAQNTNKLHVGEREVQAIFETIKMIRGYCVRFPDYKPIVLWDGRAQWRYDIFPLYKGNRDNLDPKAQANKDAYREQKPDIQLALKLLGVKQLTAEFSEADDLAAIMSMKTAEDGKKSILVTGDRDWLQLIQNGVMVYYIKSNKLCRNGTQLAELTGFDTVQKFIDYKCLVGDTSDNVPGVGGIGEKGAVEFLEKFGSVEKFFSITDKLSDEWGQLDDLKFSEIYKFKLPKVWLAFANNETPKSSKKFGEMLPMRDAYYRNRKLMDLTEVHRHYGRLDKVSSQFDEEGFMEFCEERNFRSIVNNFEEFVAPFKGN